eukprot:gene30372-35378_t
MEGSSAALQQQINALLAQTEQEGVLDGQFMQLVSLQDDSNPDFVSEVIQLYFEDGTTKIEQMGMLLQGSPPDYSELDQLVHQFKGSSASLGAQAIAELCVSLRDSCQNQDVQGCITNIQGIFMAYQLLRSRLDIYMQMEAQMKALIAAGR